MVLLMQNFKITDGNPPSVKAQGTELHFPLTVKPLIKGQLMCDFIHESVFKGLALFVNDEGFVPINQHCITICLKQIMVSSAIQSDLASLMFQLQKK